MARRAEMRRTSSPRYVYTTTTTRASESRPMVTNRCSASLRSSIVTAWGSNKAPFRIRQAHAMLAEIGLSLRGVPDRSHVCIICIWPGRAILVLGFCVPSCRLSSRWPACGRSRRCRKRRVQADHARAGHRRLRTRLAVERDARGARQCPPGRLACRAPRDACRVNGRVHAPPHQRQTVTVNVPLCGL